MAAPTPGQLELKFNRMYIVVNPDPASGPPVYRVSNPDEIPTPGGGSGGLQNINAELPLTAVQTTAITEEIAIDITLLNDLPDAP